MANSALLLYEVIIVFIYFLLTAIILLYIYILFNLLFIFQQMRYIVRFGANTIEFNILNTKRERNTDTMGNTKYKPAQAENQDDSSYIRPPGYLREHQVEHTATGLSKGTPSRRQ